MGTTTNYAFRFPGAVDVPNIPGDIQNGVQDIDTWLKANVVIRSRGTLAARPAASALVAGMLYFATDNSHIYYCENGATWIDMTVDLTGYLLSATAAATYMPKAGGVFTGSVDFGSGYGSGNILRYGQLRGMTGYRVADATTTGAIQVVVGELKELTANLTGAITLSWSTSIAGCSGQDATTAIIIREGVSPQTVTWPTGSKFAGGAAPTLAASTIYIAHISSTDAGVTNYVNVTAYA